MKHSLLTILLLLAITNAHANLITNGSFETGDFTGWTQGGNTNFTGVTNYFGYASSGSFGTFFGPVGSDGFISQTISTVAGHLYELSFWLRNEGGRTNDFSALVDGNILYSLVNIGPTVYVETILGFTATSASTDIQFNFRNDPAFWRFDNVSVVPEPDSIALLGLGLASMGFVRRRKS